MSVQTVCRVAVCCLFLAASHAEPPRSLVQGKVLDPSRTPIPGATISTVADSQLPSVSTTSDENGAFSFELPRGTFQVRIAADGFRDLQQAVVVTGAGPGDLEFLLTIAPHEDVVTISESANYQIPTSSSTKTPTPLIDVPQSIAIVSKDLIRDQSMQNMADVVRYVPGITMALGEGHRDAPVIRGNATTSDFYVNGVRDDVQYLRDLYNLERVEAVKGANALTFGRGGGGGVINRVTKEAQFYPIHEIALQGGSFGNKRGTVDFNQPLNDRVSVRLNGLYENSDSFRHGVNLERYGVSPTVSVRVSDNTMVRVSYENFNDGRTVDRGIPSYLGLPSGADRSTFFGDVQSNYATANVNLGSATIEHHAGRFNIRNSTVFGDYDKFYQNTLPGAVNATQTLVSLSGYNNATQRRNLFNQTDVTGSFKTGGLRHTFLIGTEFGRQHTDNFRNTAYFGGNNATAISVPFGDPRPNVPFAYRQSATDANNWAKNFVAATYVQDQVEVNRYVQVVGGVRYDSFDIDFHNNRTNENLNRRDNMVSPRAGLILKPVATLSIYTSYSVSYLPSSGDQFSSLTATTQTLRPEKFSNYEIGAKWDVNRSLSLTTAVYRLDRTNTTARDPNDPARIVQTGAQRTNGYELGVNGNLTRRWRVVGGYAYQDAFVSSETASALRGALVALVPHHTFSLWNNYGFTRRLGGGLGLIHQADMFAGIDNTVRIPSFTRADAAAFYSLTEMIRLQANIENLSDNRYYATAQGNNNIMPGAARTVRIGLVARF